MQIYSYELVPKSALIWHTDPIIRHGSLFGKCIGSNKRSVPNKHAMSSNWNMRVKVVDYVNCELQKRGQWQIKIQRVEVYFL